MSKVYTNNLFARNMVKVIAGGLTGTAATILGGATFLNKRNAQVSNNTAPQVTIFEGRVVPGMTPKF